MHASPAALDRRPRAPLGDLLRSWRCARGMSQFELASRAGFSTRHVSFIETGRTQPSRQALLVFAEALDVPLRERNRLLEAGGFAHVYPQTPLAAEEMSHVRGVLQFILDRHTPYPALALDRYSNCVMGNGASRLLLDLLVDPSLVTDHANHLRLTFHPLGARRWILNWDAVARHLLGRAERELGGSADPVGQALLEELRRYAGPSHERSTETSLRPADLLLPIHIRRGDLELRLFSTIMTLGTPQDVTLQELRIESFFPADEPSTGAWRRFAGSEVESQNVDGLSHVDSLYRGHDAVHHANRPSGASPAGARKAGDGHR
jgi:transcriptional regulator with XRE-family HTH domain